MSERKTTTLYEQVGKSFRAACGELQPQGRLPRGMTEDIAGRAILAFIAVQLERMADVWERDEDLHDEPYIMSEADGSAPGDVRESASRLLGLLGVKDGDPVDLRVGLDHLTGNVYAEKTVKPASDIVPASQVPPNTEPEPEPPGEPEPEPDA